MDRFLKTALRIGIVAAVVTVSAIASAPDAAAKTSFRIAWSIYVGWMPWAYAAETGIMKKWADKYGIDVELVEVGNYIESIDQYTAGVFDGCAMTNMDALTIPAASGVDSTALIIGDFSDGNDGLVLRNGISLADLKGRRVTLVEFSVSHYLLARALETAGLTEADIILVNNADTDIVPAFVFDSSMIRGEIIDLAVVNSQTLRDNPALGKALVGAWYEVMAIMQHEDDAALGFMARASGTDIAGYKAQLGATRMFYDAQAAVAFAESSDLQTTMNRVRRFSFAQGLLGKGVVSADDIGIQFPDGTVLGNADNVKLRFETSNMKLAAAGEL